MGDLAAPTNESCVGNGDPPVLPGTVDPDDQYKSLTLNIYFRNCKSINLISARTFINASGFLIPIAIVNIGTLLNSNVDQEVTSMSQHNLAC